MTARGSLCCAVERMEDVATVLFDDGAASLDGKAPTLALDPNAIEGVGALLRLADEGGRRDFTSETLDTCWSLGRTISLISSFSLIVRIEGILEAILQSLGSGSIEMIFELLVRNRLFLLDEDSLQPRVKLP